MKTIIRKHSILLYYLILSSISLHAQKSIGGTPLSISGKQFFESFKAKNIKVDLPDLNNKNEQLLANSISKQKHTFKEKSYYGKGINISIDIKEEGQCFNLDDGSKLWLLKIESETAYGMQFYFDKFYLPEGAKLYIFNEDGHKILGAFTSENNPIDRSKKIQFGTQYIMGNEIYIEYSEPKDTEFSGVINITNVIHIFKDIFSKGDYGTSGACNIDVACDEGIGWDKEISSVALILAYNNENQLAYHGTGALINNDNDPVRAYFLTANHLIDEISYPNGYDTYTWLFIFNYQKETCEQENYNYTEQSILGAVPLENDEQGADESDFYTSDYLLLELNNTTANDLASMGACLSGWTLSTELPPPYTGIHHPSGDVKSISIENDVCITYRAFWIVDCWDQGVTEQGSSGSPLFNSDHRIIGQLLGGNSWCDGQNIDPCGQDWYGKFSTSWGDGNFSWYLDPNLTGITSMDTYCPVEDDDDDPPPPPPSPYTSCDYNFSDGISVNGDWDFNRIVCIENLPISLTPPTWCTYNYFNIDYRQNIYNCSETPNNISEYCNRLILTPWQCICQYNEYFLEIMEVDENLNQIGIAHSKYIQLENSIPFDAYLDECIIDENVLSEIDIVLQPGHFYKIKLAKNTPWIEGARYIRYLPESDIILSDITIEDEVSYATSGSITIQPQTSLKAGSYKIDNSCDPVENYSNSIISDPEEDIQKTTVKEEINTDFREIIGECGCDNEDKGTGNVFENEDLSNIKIVPNPFTNTFEILFSGDINPNRIEIVDISGKIVYSENLSNKMNKRVDSSTLSKGIYIVRLYTDTGILFKKIVKQ